MKTTELTTKERQIITIAVLKTGTTAERLLEDNYSWFTMEDFKTLFNEHQFAGLISSLDAKGLLHFSEVHKMKMVQTGKKTYTQKWVSTPLWCLTEEGVKAAIEIGL